MMAEALAIAGHEVHYISNNKPIFYDDFSMYPNHDDINFCHTPDFQTDIPEGNFDIVFLIPSMSLDSEFYVRALFFTRSREAKLVLLNFETPNWFNSLSPEKRPFYYWDYWKCSSKFASMILSSAKESNDFARLFFTSSPAVTRFNYCYPSINSIVADSVKSIKKEKRIILLTRFQLAEHKGGFESSNLICEAMRGYTLVLIVGTGDVPDNVMGSIISTAIEHGVLLEIKYKLADYEKFQEIKRSSLMLFPSYFEGFGLPPVEALYCNVPCICFDLPVLREVSGNGLIYVRPGDWSEFRAKIKDVLDSNQSDDHLHENVANIATIESYSKRIDSLISQFHLQSGKSANSNDKFVFTTSIVGRSLFYIAFKHYFINLIKQISGIFRLFWRLLRFACLTPLFLAWHFLLIFILRPTIRAVLMRLFPGMPGENIKEETIHYLRKLMSRK
jgi:glycosyltransferase involved in cell wall biosynthesis